MQTNTETLLCERNIFVFCKMFNYDYINDCSKEIELFGITFYRPILFLICILAIILSLSSFYNSLTKFGKHMRGKVEYAILHLLSAVWFLLLMADRCLVYYIELPGTIVILSETSVKILLVFSFLNCSLIDFFNVQLQKVKYCIKPIAVYCLAFISIALLLTGYFISVLFFEIVYLISVYLPIGLGIILYFISSIFMCRERLITVLLLTINVLLFSAGLILYLLHNQDVCDLMIPYFASEEIFALTTSLSLWLFFRFSKKLKERVLEGKKIGEMEFDGELLDVELHLA